MTSTQFDALQDAINDLSGNAEIDGNGKTLTIPDQLNVGDKVTLKNLTIVVSPSSGLSRTAADWSGKGIGAITVKGDGLIENCTFESPLTQYDIVVEGNVTIKDCKFLTATADNDDLKDGEKYLGKRAVYIKKSVDVTIENCQFATEVYAFNTSIPSSDPKNGVLTVSGSNIDGWASWDGLASASFTNCSFSKSGNYEGCRPYINTTWTNCTFSKDYKIGCRYDGLIFKFVDCTQNGADVTESIVTATDASGITQDPEDGTPEIIIE